MSEFLIYTTSEDERRIRAHPAYGRLRQLIEVVFLPLEITSEHKYDLMKRAHSNAIMRARNRGYCVFLAPDALLSNGMLERLYELCLSGRRVVAGFGPRLNQEAVIDELVARPDHVEGAPLELSSRELVAFAMRHLHQDFLDHFADSPRFPTKPYCCVWPGPDGEGMLVRSIGLHPYLFDCRLVGPDADLVNATIDHNLMPRFVNDFNEFYVETDSDNFNIYGLTPRTVRAKPGAANRLTTEDFSLWLLRTEYSFLNRASFAYALKFHARPLDAAWDELIRQTQEFAIAAIDPSRSLLDWTRIGYAIRSLPRTLAADKLEKCSVPPDEHTAQVFRATAATGQADLSQVPFFYTFAIWGQRYVDYLARWAIPTMLAANNLPALPNLAVSKVVIATTVADEKRMRARAEFRMLARFIETEIVYTPALAEQSDKYVGLRMGHTNGAQLATGRGFAVFLAPDAIYPDGMFSALYRRVAEGKQIVVGMGPRVAEESIVEELSQAGRLDHAEPLVVPPREAASLLMRHMHEDVRRQRWSSPFFASTPYMCVWDIGGGDGLVVRPFSLHPYIVDYRDTSSGRISPAQGAVIDGTFVADCLVPWNKIHQVTDSDEFVVLSVTPTNTVDFPREVNPEPFATLAAWARRPDITMLHRAYFMNALKIHTRDLDERWRQLEQETLDIAYRVVNPLIVTGRPDTVAADQHSDQIVRFNVFFNELFDKSFIDRFPSAFDAHFHHLFPKWFDDAFVARFAHPFEVHFKQNFDAAFAAQFPAALERHMTPRAIAAAATRWLLHPLRRR